MSDPTLISPLDQMVTTTDHQVIEKVFSPHLADVPLLVRWRPTETFNNRTKKVKILKKPIGSTSNPNNLHTFASVSPDGKAPYGLLMSAAHNIVKILE